eukprot:1624192-Lingulodinium_polyedra.AAC.1
MKRTLRVAVAIAFAPGLAHIRQALQVSTTCGTNCNVVCGTNAEESRSTGSASALPLGSTLPRAAG